MSEPIDFIDLTIDSTEKVRTEVSGSRRTRNRSRNIENIPNNGPTTTKSRKRPTKQSAQLHDSVVEIPVDNECRSKESTEIIDLDSPANADAYCINDPTEGNVFVLTCPICFEKLSSKMKPMSTRCGHIFCTQCLELALRASKKCPTCKKAVKIQNCTRLYF
ncbi:E3 ubiquitin-protein ligase RNF4 [Calliopsis andreniformis]|uniref:E3 ubiquitin-protein ligase RNF4 n=1 Tax=Calliopsis andreniformis TaxID=337506 RepID=UPI003FCC5272